LKRIPSLDGFRAISIILILICHARFSAGFPSQYSDLIRHASIGVTVFFVISGFLITNLLLTEEAKYGRISAGNFYIRRAFRILPVFLLYCLFVIIMSRLGFLILTTENLIHTFTFTVNFEVHNNWFIGHFWSLSVEEQFYLLWPLLLICFRKNLKPILVVMLLYTCIARVINFKFPAYSAVTLSPFFLNADAILIGAFAGIYYSKDPDIINNKIFRSYWLKALALGLIVLFTYTSGYGKLALISLPFGGLFIGAGILFLILSYLAPSEHLFYKFLNSKIMVHIGILSYSLYVWQEFFFTGKANGWWHALPINIFIIYVISLASYYLWEKPFLKLRQRFLS
jgi:peptidoglycan/LPS O-acetylase OafA/YrhL